MIAFHFPPLRGSSGIQRTLRFVQHLPRYGWQPIVLTAHPRAYESRSDDLTAEVPEGTEVIRAPAWDAARHFSIRGKYPSFAARPDRWMSWLPGAVLQGAAAIRRYRPIAIWSTFPIATAHKIGKHLAKLSGLPWIADFRDPMAQEGYPSNPVTWRHFERIERETIALADVSTFTTPGARELYARRYPAQREKIIVIENGYDEDSFSNVSCAVVGANESIVLVHSGTVYPKERDPSALMVALRMLKESAPDSYRKLKIRFRAAAHENLIRELAEVQGVSEAIEIAPSIQYRAALSEMLSADGLLVLQSASCNEQIPAKLYEYIRARRPIIALTDPRGDTAGVLQRAGIDSIAPLDDPQAIQQLLLRFCTAPTSFPLPNESAVAGASRSRRSEELAELLARLTEARESIRSRQII